MKAALTFGFVSAIVGSLSSLAIVSHTDYFWVIGFLFSLSVATTILLGLRVRLCLIIP
jgi:hypothetical protein